MDQYKSSDTPETGDINSSAKGTGARYNNDKIPYEYLPLELILNWLDNTERVHIEPGWHAPQEILRYLALWQSGADEALDCALEAALDGNLNLTGFADAARVFKYVTTRKVKPYPAWNWKRGMPWMVPYGCAIRHVLSEITGAVIDDDPETGTNLPHRGHLICNLIMLLEYRSHYTDGDNRPPRL